MTKRNFKKYKREEKTEKTSRDYIDKDEFYTALVDYNKQLQNFRVNNYPKEKEPVASDYIGKCFIQIVENLLRSHRFKGYTDLWKDEMRAEAIISCIKSLKNFDVEKTKNPFSYFTTVAYYTFYNVIKREKQFHQTALDSFVELHTDYTDIGADGFTYYIPDEIHNKLQDSDIDMLESREFQRDIEEYNTWEDEREKLNRQFEEESKNKKRGRKSKHDDLDQNNFDNESDEGSNDITYSYDENYDMENDDDYYDKLHKRNFKKYISIDKNIMEMFD